MSKIRISEGRTVTQQITPKTTPLAITTPRSRPKVKLMKQRAMKPATVVIELPITDTRVLLIATAMAFLLSSGYSSFSSQ